MASTLLSCSVCASNFFSKAAIFSSIFCSIFFKRSSKMAFSVFILGSSGCPLTSCSCAGSRREGSSFILTGSFSLNSSTFKVFESVTLGGCVGPVSAPLVRNCCCISARLVLGIFSSAKGVSVGICLVEWHSWRRSLRASCLAWRASCLLSIFSLMRAKIGPINSILFCANSAKIHKPTGAPCRKNLLNEAPG